MRLTPIFTTIAVALAIAACSDDPADTDDASASDTGVRLDATVNLDATAGDTGVHPDAAASDSGVHSDAAASDTGVHSDAEPADSGEPEDSGVEDVGVDAGTACPTGLGGMCQGGNCEAPLECADPPTLCLPPMRDTCGGFAGATCPATLPVCMFFAGADYGPCFTNAEVACICAQPNAHANFPACP